MPVTGLLEVEAVAHLSPDYKALGVCGGLELVNRSMPCSRLYMIEDKEMNPT